MAEERYHIGVDVGDGRDYKTETIFKNGKIVAFNTPLDFGIITQKAREEFIRELRRHEFLMKETLHRINGIKKDLP